MLDRSPQNCSNEPGAECHEEVTRTMGISSVIPYVDTYIDPNVSHVGVSKLRTLNASKLREMDRKFVIQENDEPLAVILTFDDYLRMQDLQLRIVSQLLHEGEIAGMEAGLKDLQAGRTRSISEVRESFRRRRKRGKLDSAE